jgi:hypothetical protein
MYPPVADRRWAPFDAGAGPSAAFEGYRRIELADKGAARETASDVAGVRELATGRDLRLLVGSHGAISMGFRRPGRPHVLLGGLVQGSRYDLQFPLEAPDFVQRYLTLG